MMRRLFLLGLLLPVTVSAASIFDTVWEESEEVLRDTEPSDLVLNFVIEEAKRWNTHGIVLTKDDLLDLYGDSSQEICVGKKDTEGNNLTFAAGSAADSASCGALTRDLLNILTAEKEAEQLGHDLLAQAVGSELAIADEPRPPLDLPSSIRGLQRTWQATGSTVLPWDEEADDALQELETALSDVGEDLPEVVLRFHHGFFRDKREQDPRFVASDDAVVSALSRLSGMLKIDPNTKNSTEILTPGLSIPNVSLWAREDDLGLLWVSPSKEWRLSFTVPQEYPVLKKHADQLAYPYAYEGDQTPPDFVLSPLCSRPMARHGYLCRPIESPEEDCADPEPDEIVLRMCPPKPKVETVSETLSTCLNTYPIFADDGTPLFDPDNPSELSPDLKKAAPGTICQPESKVQYPTSVLSHLCYTDVCLRESMSGHSLMPGRNAVLAYESTSPYLACIRPDPALATYVESPGITSTPLPPYLGHMLAQDFVREYCAINGNAPHPLAGYCLYQDNFRASVPSSVQVRDTTKTAQEASIVWDAQTSLTSLASAAGERLAVDQSIGTHRALTAPLAAFVQQIADLWNELTRAPLTQSACPWTGPPRTPSPPPAV